MACACPCFGDEADAEEKPNQMIQLDGLGMLRLDTQHVGQGSQGARSAKWFYFGETDNRLAVVNMLLCITCFLMWILFISAASPYIWGANPSGTTSDVNRNQESDLKVVQAENVELDKKYKQLLLDHESMTNNFGNLKGEQEQKDTLVQQLQVLEAEKSALCSKKVLLEKDLNKFKDAKKILGNNNNELTEKVEKLKEDIAKLEKDLSAKEAISERWRDMLLEIHDKRFRSACRRSPSKMHPWTLEEFPLLFPEYIKLHPLQESKVDDDANKDANYDKNNENEVNTNGVEYQNLSNTEPGTNVDKQ
eukprot:175844_1